MVTCLASGAVGPIVPPPGLPVLHRLLQEANLARIVEDPFDGPRLRLPCHNDGTASPNGGGRTGTCDGLNPILCPVLPTCACPAPLRLLSESHLLRLVDMGCATAARRRNPRACGIRRSRDYLRANILPGITNVPRRHRFGRGL